MITLKKFERIRKVGLRCIFLGSTLIFIIFLVPAVHSWYHPGRSIPHYDAIYYIATALVIALAAAALWRFRLTKKYIKMNPDLRRTLKDERANFNRLKAYRLAFFILLIIQVASKLPVVLLRILWEVPGQSQISLSAAVMTWSGAFLFYNRENKHD